MRKIVLSFILFLIFNSSSSFSFGGNEYFGNRDYRLLQVSLGSRVNFGSYTGVASELLANDEVKVRLDNSGGYVYKNVYVLGLGVECLEYICEDSRVSFHSNVGTVVEVFNNENVKIRLDDQSDFIIKKSSELSRSLDYLDSMRLWGMAKGDSVIFQNFMGYLAHVFENGNVEICLNDKYKNCVHRYAHEVRVVNKVQPSYPSWW